MLLICSVVLGSVSLILAILMSQLTMRYERNEYIKKYDIALYNLQSVFEEKNKNLYNSFYSLITSASGYNDLCKFLKDENLYQTDNKIKSNVSKIMINICERDSKCVGILLYSQRTQKLYHFNKKYKSMSTLATQESITDIFPTDKSVIGDRVLSFMSKNFTKPSTHIYGMTGKIYSDFGQYDDLVGQIVLLYPTSELLEAINNQYLAADSLFSIISSEGAIWFRSSGDDYLAGKDLIRNNMNKETNKVITLPTETRKLNQKLYYTSSIYNGRYGYYVTYQVEKSGKQIGYTSGLILLFAVLICCFAIILYIMTYYSTEKKLKIIQKGMNKIGSNNLDYRIPPVKSQDEFAQIINGFNRMCQELKKNVEQSYVYELAQKQAELYALQSSINPHFLYNTLEMIRVQILQGEKEEASQMIVLLSKIYRNQMHRDLYVSIGEELEQCENLMFLYQYRFQNFEYDFSVPTTLYAYGLPKNTLQPLIENYFVHGIDSKCEDNYFEITGSLVEQDGEALICLTLQNNGFTIRPEELEELKNKIQRKVFKNNETKGFAMANVNSRLKIVFGDQYGIFPDTGVDDAGFKVTILFPPVLSTKLIQKNQTENRE